MKKSHGFFKLTKLYESMFSAPTGRRISKKPARVGVECLEARETPTSYTWTPTAAGTFDWNNAANWGGAGFPNAADDVANINIDIAAGTQIINLNVPIKVGTLNLGDSVVATAGIINIAANGGSLTFDVTSGSAALNKTTGSASDTINAPLQLADPLAINNTVNLQLGGVVSESGGAKSITKAGTGALILGGTNTFTGGISVGAGAVSIAAGANLGSGPLSFTGVSALNVTGTAVTIPNNISLGSVNGQVTLATPNSSNTVISGIVSGGIATTVWFFQGGASGQNTGALTLTGANTFQGAINVQRGPLLLANATAAGTANIILDSNLPTAGSLQLAGTFTIANNVTLVGEGEGFGVVAGTAGISGVISGAHSILKVGAGTLVLSGTNTLTGGIKVAAGGLTIASAANLGPGPLAFTGVSALNIAGTAVTIPNNISLGTVNGRVTILTPNNSSTVISGIVSGGAATTEWFFQGGDGGQNTGALALNGVNTLQGAINVQRGPLILGNASAAGTAVILLDSNLPPAGALQFAGNFTIPNNIVLISGNEPFGVAAGLTGGIGGVISGTTPITKVGDGTLALAGNNTYTGVTTVAAGTLQIGNGGSTGNLGPGAVTVNSTLAFKRNDNALVVGNEITGTGALVQAGTGSTTLTNINNVYNGGTTVNAGTLILANVNGSATGTGPITINSTGTLAGTGSGSGDVSINSGGTVAMTGTGSLAGAITVKTGGTLAGTATYAGSVAAGGNVSPGGAAPGIMGVADITFADGAAKGTFVVNLNGTTAGISYDQLTVSGNVNITGATLSANPGYVYFGNDKVTLINNNASGPIVGTFTGMAEGSTVTLGGQAFTITYKGGDGNDLVLTKQAPQVRYVDDAWAALAPGAQIADADPVATGNQPAVVGTTAFGTINAGIAAAPALGILVINAGTYPEAVVINKALGLVFQEGAITVNSLADTVTGASISIGTDASSAPITLTVGNATDTTIGSLITGPGNLTKVGTGALTLAGSNYYSGATTISNGVLKVGSLGALSPSTSAIAIDAAATLRLNGVSAAAPSLTGAGKIENASATPASVTFGGNGLDASFSGTIQDGAGGGALSVIKTGAGILTLPTTTNSYTGSTTVNAGTLAITNVAAAASNSSIGSGTANISMADGTTLQIQGTGAMTTARGFVLSGAATVEITNAATTVTTSGVVSGGSNPFSKTGNGKLIFTASEALNTGNISVSAGTLGFATQSLSKTRLLDIADGAFVESSGTLNLLVGAGSFDAVTGAGTLRLVGTANNATTSPDLYFGPNHVSNTFDGMGIATKLDLGSVERFALAKSGNNGFGVYAPNTDAAIRGDIIGSGGLTIIGQQVNNAGDEVPYAFFSNANSFTGPLTITRGSLYLNHGADLTGVPDLKFNPTAGNRARLFLWGNSITVGSLSSSGAGIPGIANGIRPNGSGAVDNGPVTLTVTQKVDGTYSGLIADVITERSNSGTLPTGAFSLTKTGAATLTLSGGLNSYTGATTINQGVLSISNIANGLANSDIGASDNTAANLVLGGGVLSYSGASASTDRGFTVGATTGGIEVTNAASALTFTGSVTGTGNLTKTGSGILILNGVNNYTGTTTVAKGTLGGSGNSASATTMSGILNPGTPTAAGAFNSGNLAFGIGGILAVNVSGAASGLPVAGTDYDQVKVTGTVNLTNSLLLLLPSNVLTKLNDTLTIIANDGTDAVTGTFTGQPQNSQISVAGQVFKIDYAGGDGNDVVLTRVQATTVYADDSWSSFTNGQAIADADPVLAGNQPATFGTSAFATITAAIAAANAGSSLVVNAGTYNEAVNINKLISLTFQEGPITINSLNGTLSGTAVTLQGITLTTGDATSTEFSGAIVGAGGLTKIGSGTFKISGANLFTGPTTVNGGVLSIGASAALLASPLTINSGGTVIVSAPSTTFAGVTLNLGGKLQLNGNSISLTALSGAGTLENANAAAATLTLNAATDITFAGLIQDGVGGGALSLTKTGAGALILSGTASTYTGPTTISGGVLSVNTLANGGSPSSIGQSSNAATNLVLAGGTTLQITGPSASSDRSLTLGTGGSTIAVSNANTTLTISGTIAGGANPFTKDGAGKLAFTNDDAFGTRTTASTYGSITTGNIKVLAGELQTGYLRLNESRGAGVRRLSIAANAVMTATGTVDIDPKSDVYVEQIAGPGTLKLRNPSASKSNPSLANDIGPIGGDGGPFGTFVTAKIDVGTSGTQWFVGRTNRNDLGRYAGDFRFDAPIVGSGNIQLVGTNTNGNRAWNCVFNADNSGFTGSVFIANCSLDLTNDKALTAANAVTFNTAIDPATQNKSILFLWGRDITIGSLNDVSDAGTANFIRNGSRDLPNGGTNTNNNGATLGVALGLQEDSTLTINQTTPGIFKGRIADGPNDNDVGDSGPYRTLSIVKNGAGALTLTGDNSGYTGTTTVNAGSLLASNTTPLSSTDPSTGSGTGAGLTTVSANGTLGGIGTIVGDVTVKSGGALAPGAAGPGRLTAGNVSLEAGAITKMDINGATAGTSYDQLHVTGAISLNGTLNVSLGTVPANGTQFLIIDNDVGASAGTFTGLAEGATFVAGGTTFKITYAGGTDNKDVVLTAQSSTAVSTTTTLVASPLATTGGSSVMFTATVAPSPGASGTVTFLDNGVAITGGANVAVTGGVAVFTTTTLAVGSHPVTASYSGAAGFGPSTSSVQTVVVSAGGTAPAVNTVTFNGGLTGFTAAQRSRIINVAVEFNQPVILDTGAMSLALHTNNVNYAGNTGGTGQPNGAGVPATLIPTPSTDNKTWTLTWSGANTEVGSADQLASLKDGVYDLVISATKVHPVGSLGVNMAANSTTVFHRLFGDTNAPTASGNDFTAVLAGNDNLAFRGAFNKPVGGGYVPFLDFNGDGNINSGDNLAFRARFNKTLTWTV